jgi:hypothetical protein
MYYWNWEKKLNQFYYDYNKTMAELADGAAKEVETSPNVGALSGLYLEAPQVSGYLHDGCLRYLGLVSICFLGAAAPFFCNKLVHAD